jgi:hypothetical protein
VKLKLELKHRFVSDSFHFLTEVQCSYFINEFLERGFPGSFSYSIEAGDSLNPDKYHIDINECS